MTAPLVSIVTPSYKQARFLEATIQSVISQNYPRIEYIVADGGSDDGSVDNIKKYADKLAWWVSEEDKGQTDALSKGFARATGDIFAWLNSDDTYEPGAVAAAVEFLQAHPEVGMVYADCNYINEDGKVIGQFPAAQTDLRRLKQGYVHIPQQTTFFRAELFQRAGGLNKKWYFAMDYDLWRRMAANAPFQYLAGQTWANFRMHTASKTIAADDRCWPEMYQIHREDGGSIFSILAAKHYLRKFVAPLWNWMRRKRLGL